jgi:hypothetical protein
MTLEKIKELEKEAFNKLKKKYRGMDVSDWQTILISFQMLNELIEREEKPKVY